jgi:hypothetical protein
MIYGQPAEETVAVAAALSGAVLFDAVVAGPAAGESGTVGVALSSVILA